MQRNLRPSNTRTYIIVYGEPGRYAKAALKIKLPNNIINNTKAAASYMRKFLEKGEVVTTAVAYEDLSFLKEIETLPIWNEEEEEEPKKQKGRPKRTTKKTTKTTARTKKENGVEEFENLNTFLKGEPKDEGSDEEGKTPE